MCSNNRFEDNKTSFCEYLSTKEKDGMLDPYDILKQLGKKGITSVLIEGGKKVHETFFHVRFYSYSGSKFTYVRF